MEGIESNHFNEDLSDLEVSHLNLSEGGRKIFVGGLKWITTEDTLRSYFSEFGPVESVIIMKDKETLRPRGFAFVTFEKEKSVEDALCQPHHEVDGRRIEAKKAIPKSKSKRLFVGGIHPHVDSDDLREYFSQFGEVRDSQVIRTKSSKSRGFGFIKFDDDNVTEEVLKQVHVLKDKQMEVKIAEPRKYTKPIYAPPVYPMHYPHYVISPIHPEYIFLVNTPIYYNGPNEIPLTYGNVNRDPVNADGRLRI